MLEYHALRQPLIPALRWASVCSQHIGARFLLVAVSYARRRAGVKSAVTGFMPFCGVSATVAIL